MEPVITWIVAFYLACTPSMVCIETKDLHSLPTMTSVGVDRCVVVLKDKEHPSVVNKIYVPCPWNE